ncbi:M20/M25/M40 family metallo-hydrolase [Mycobacterium crocinum]|uniref:M20/M25/M40 family metallo-hydrolase n=1 Tax=Mycolicibacterium crocinum TaxID=388459 RepID=A0ABY3TNC3_9MYCO|nr:M20/M25/M40 family metallo-hydrolase [Mycolicibacterium crocinum]MCV7218111.1 M20/M25/M40 family metallo-hydrolase [Mycolicibacterium crocinum]ULN40442.1 M20/M25/M40 family metallo-hydrolase [Mycolicibacterium crocinum]
MTFGELSPGVEDVVALTQHLVRIDTSNPGGAEKPAAELVADVLAGIGIGCHWFEPEPGRVSIVGRIAGRDPTLPALLLHAHLDVVPAIDSDWTRDPFGGDLHDGYIWGRGTVDMKGPVAITLAALQRLSRRGQPPRRDVVLAFFADEEAGGALGAGYVTQSSPELFADCAEAIGEVGGFSHTLTTDHRGYFVSTAEKGVWWARLRASGVAGHGSMINPDNSINTLAQALVRLADLTAPAPIRTTATDSLIERLREVLAEPVVDDDLLACLGHFDRMIRAGRHNTINATQVSGGYKTNVVPAEASATIDARFLPGHDCSFQRQLTEIIGPAVALETLYHGPAVEAAMDTPLLGAIAEALRGSDPMATVLPYMSTAFTDAKWLHRLGIQCYGFTPMRLPDDLDFTALFHGANERVPVDSLRFGVDVLSRLLTSY